LATALSVTSIAADAGVTRAGNSGRNIGRAHSYASNIGSHGNIGAGRQSISRSSGLSRSNNSMSHNVAHQTASYIESHGGTVNVSKNSGTATVNVTTGNGGTFSSQAVQNNKVSGLWYDTSSNATTAKGKTYSGTGYAYKSDVYAASGTGEPNKGTMQGVSHSGTVKGDSRSVSVGGTRAETVFAPGSNTTSTFGHSHSISGNVNQHYRYMDFVVYNDSGDHYIKRSETNNLYGKNGNSLETKTRVAIDSIDGITTVTPNYAGDAYVIYNGHPVTPPSI
jgi:hypothetical protein